jgi:putative oxidoreductase
MMQTAIRNTPTAGRIGRLYAMLEDVLNGLQPYASLAIRLYVAKVFALSGWLKVSRWDSTLALFENEYHVPLVSPHAAAVLGTAAELALPLLFVLGIRGRAVALALFVFNVVAVISYPDLSAAGFKDHVLWGALMLVVAFYGPGRFSADRWMAAARESR